MMLVTLGYFTLYFHFGSAQILGFAFLTHTSIIRTIVYHGSGSNPNMAKILRTFCWTIQVVLCLGCLLWSTQLPVSKSLLFIFRTSMIINITPTSLGSLLDVCTSYVVRRNFREFINSGDIWRIGFSISLTSPQSIPNTTTLSQVTWVNYPAVLLVLFCTLLLANGARASKVFTNVSTAATCCI